MTIEKKLEKYLEANGLWPDEAATVVARMKADDHVMAGQWQDQPEDYPTPMFGLLMMSARDEAIAFLEAEKPKHFALGLLRMKSAGPNVADNRPEGSG